MMGLTFNTSPVKKKALGARPCSTELPQWAAIETVKPQLYCAHGGVLVAKAGVEQHKAG